MSEVLQSVEPTTLVHALVSDAGASPKGARGERLEWMTMLVETWTQVFQVNILAPALLARGLLEEMQRGQGSIVNVSSIVGGRVHPFGHTRQLDRAGRNSNGNDLARNRKSVGADHPDARARAAPGSRPGRFPSALQLGKLRYWRGNPDQWRPTRLGVGARKRRFNEIAAKFPVNISSLRKMRAS